MVKFIDYSIIIDHMFNYIKRSFEGITWDRLGEAVNEIMDYGRGKGIAIIGSRSVYYAAEKLCNMFKGLGLNTYIKRLESSSFNGIFIIIIDHPMDCDDVNSFISNSKFESCRILSITYSYDSPSAKISDYAIVLPYLRTWAKNDLLGFLISTSIHYDLQILFFITILSSMMAQAVGRVERYIGAFIEL